MAAASPAAAADNLRDTVERTLGASYPIFANRAGAAFKMGSPEEKASLAASVDGVMKLLPADCTAEAFKLTICGLGSTHVASDAMLPTMRVREAIFFAPYSTERPVQRGDVVIFDVLSGGPTPLRYTFRVIGMPGETVELISGVVNINGIMLKLNPTDEQTTGSTGGEPINLFRETTPEGRAYLIGQNASGPPFDEADTAGPYAVPAGHFFVLGDNRHNASDSRFSFTRGAKRFVSLDQIVGRIAMIYVSADPKRTGLAIDAE